MLIPLMAFDNPRSADLSNNSSTREVLFWSPLSVGPVNDTTGGKAVVMKSSVVAVIQILIPCVEALPFLPFNLTQLSCHYRNAR